MPKSRLIGPTRTPRIWRSMKALTLASMRTATTYHAYVGRGRGVAGSIASNLARHWRVGFTEDTFEYAPSRHSDRCRSGHYQLLQSDVLLHRVGDQQRYDTTAARRDARRRVHVGRTWRSQTRRRVF